MPPKLCHLAQASRERVREYAAKASTLTTARAAMSSVQGELQALQADYRQLADERQVQSKITEKYWGDQQQLDGQIEGIFKERRRIKELQVCHAAQACTQHLCDKGKLICTVSLVTCHANGGGLTAASDCSLCEDKPFDNACLLHWAEHGPFHTEREIVGQDEVYNEYKAHEQEQRQRSGAYQRNRTFSQQVGQLSMHTLVIRCSSFLAGRCAICSAPARICGACQALACGIDADVLREMPHACTCASQQQHTGQSFREACEMLVLTCAGAQGAEGWPA